VLHVSHTSFVQVQSHVLINEINQNHEINADLFARCRIRWQTDRN
jgi:hypothetical protein